MLARCYQLLTLERLTQPAELIRKLRRLVVRVETARIWQHPETRPIDPLILLANGGPRTLEREAVHTDAEYSEYGGLIPEYLPLESPAAKDEVGGVQLRGRRGGSGNQIRDAELIRQKLSLLPGVQESRREARRVERRPEAVPRPRKVMSYGGAIKPGVDTAEEHREPGPDDVADL